jgi:PIN domain nuclease of toxin-antitoxin system
VIVLDTHTLVWWAAGGPLSDTAAAIVQRNAASHSLFASSITTWEIGMLVDKGRLELTIGVVDWIKRVEVLPEIHFVPVDNDIALASTRLPGSLHPDPADRIIVATARALDAPLVTRDESLHRYSHVETIW